MTALSKTIRPVGGYGMFAERGFHGMRSSHMPVFAAEGSEGGGDNGAAELEAARLAAEAAEEAATVAEAARVEAARLLAAKKLPPTDNEVKLLKELMDLKKKGKEKDELLKTFEGIDAAAARAAAAVIALAEEEALKKSGDFDTLKARMKEAHQIELAAATEKLTLSQVSIAAFSKQITELTIGADFANSKFIKEETVLTPRKARLIYEDHFEIEDGKTVGYTAPRGSSTRAPIVNGSGEPLEFDEAMKRIVEGDSEKDSLLRSKAKSGSGQNNEAGKGKEPTNEKTVEARGSDRIAIALRALQNK